MKKTAAVLAMLVAALLLSTSLMEYRQDAMNAAASTREDFELLHEGNTAALHDDEVQSESRRNTEEIEGVAGAAFFIAGIALFNIPAQHREAAAS